MRAISEVFQVSPSLLSYKSSCPSHCPFRQADKPIRDFVKRLLGRLVFLHFLQKRVDGLPQKSGFGFSRNAPSISPKGETTLAWTAGDPDFLNSYFALAHPARNSGLWWSPYRRRPSDKGHAEADFDLLSIR